MLSEQQEKWIERISELFLRFGIKSITMDDIARELGISKKTLYQFVDNKNDLVLKVVNHHLRKEVEMGECWQQEATDAVEEMLLVIQNITKEMQLIKTNIVYDMQKYHRDAWEYMEKHQQGHIMQQVQENLKRGIREGLYRDDFDVEMIARLHVAQSFQLFNEDWFPQPEFSRDRLFREYVLHYLHGILSEKGRKRLESAAEKYLKTA